MLSSAWRQSSSPLISSKSTLVERVPRDDNEVVLLELREVDVQSGEGLLDCLFLEGLLLLLLLQHLPDHVGAAEEAHAQAKHRQVEQPVKHLPG